MTGGPRNARFRDYHTGKVVEFRGHDRGYIKVQSVVRGTAYPQRRENLFALNDEAREVLRRVS